MAGTSRIDELRKKFDENPRRYFAPLANEYRKIGDFEQAIFICQEFLPQQPGHMSGHIVYGQALFESGRHDEARSVFETALALDPENLIALRHLGDIARAHGDNETAGAWYRRVLESDPRNEEIAGILTALDADRSTAPPPAPASATTQSAGAPIAVESAISAATAAGDAQASSAPRGDPIVSDPLAAAPSESSFDDVAKLFTSAAPPTTAPTDESLRLIHEGEDLLAGSAAPSSAAAEANAPFGDQIEKEIPPLGEPEPAVAPAPAAAPAESIPTPSFNLPFLDGLTTGEPEPAARPPVPEASPPPAPAEQPARAPVADANTAFVTQTMAELYVKQGHRDQAIDVYRQLVQLHPNDAALAARLHELESPPDRTDQRASTAPETVAMAEAGPTIREFLGLIADFRPGTGVPGGPAVTAPPPLADVAPPNEPPAASARQTVGDSLSSLFAAAEKETATHRTTDRADLARSTAGPAASAPTGATIAGRPSTPAATELSLDHVFRHATPASGTGSHSSFSFDQFFSQQAQQDVTAADAEPANEESAGLSDDIQQFNAWLEGLKKT